MHPVVIVAHGQPSEPMVAEGALAELARAVAVHLPGRQVGSATLAAPGALAEAVAGRGAEGRIYPLFMAGGWFARVQLPARLKAAGAVGWRVLEPFGCDGAVQDLAVQLAVESGAGEVILAAHGSFKSRVPSDIARHVAGLIAAKGQSVRLGFIDQDPQLSALGPFGQRSICLPFFAAEGGHVSQDIPAALAKAGFAGRILPPLGADARVPALIAAAINADRAVCAEACRWSAERGQSAHALWRIRLCAGRGRNPLRTRCASRGRIRRI